LRRYRDRRTRAKWTMYEKLVYLNTRGRLTRVYARPCEPSLIIFFYVPTSTQQRRSPRRKAYWCTTRWARAKIGRTRSYRSIRPIVRKPEKINIISYAII
jgi:hypothetical protein